MAKQNHCNDDHHHCHDDDNDVAAVSAEMNMMTMMTTPQLWRLPTKMIGHK